LKARVRNKSGTKVEGHNGGLMTVEARPEAKPLVRGLGAGIKPPETDDSLLIRSYIFAFITYIQL